MANTTARSALSVHGTNPQFLVEKTVRSRIYDSVYWKEHCFALTAETLIDKAVSLQYVGGLYGLQRATPFLCLVQKLLQLQPEREIIIEYLHAHEFKYLRAVTAMYIRLTFRALDVYELLEPLLNDYRKLRWRDMAGNYTITYMDSFIDSLLRESRVCDISLPLLTRRDVVEDLEGLAPRISKLQDALLAQTEIDTETGTESDDSAAEERRQRKLRIQRAASIRKARIEQQNHDQEQLVHVEYSSQQDSDPESRFVSRSPSPSLSPDRKPSGAWISRSPSRSPDRHQSPPEPEPESELEPEPERFMSRSLSRSPDRD